MTFASKERTSFLKKRSKKLLSDRRFLALLLIPILTLAAAPPPRYLPARDAMITYRSTGSDARLPPNLSVRYSADLGRIRIDGVPLGYLLVDRPMERVELIMPQPRLILQLPPGGGIVDGFILGPGLHFTQTGTDKVLGRACTLYDVSTDRDRAHGRVCLTPDGLLLRGEGQGRDGRNASIEATSVAIAPQPVGLFAPPDGYNIVALNK